MLLLTYLIYLILSLAITVWVGSTLFGSGRAFLIEAFKGNSELADSVNKLLIVGFYLINSGYVIYNLQSRHHPATWPSLIEVLSDKLGLILVVLGIMHFGNIWVLTKLRKAGKSE